MNAFSTTSSHHLSDFTKSLTIEDFEEAFKSLEKYPLVEQEKAFNEYLNKTWLPLMARLVGTTIQGFIKLVEEGNKNRPVYPNRNRKKT